ncbi:hypothetical protein MMC10_008051 [Thelotrema lepadinum]|nr:hypothetical protein [Thelotrema lepadinum]
MTKRLLNKIAIVTGSSSGVGRAIARAYSREGASVVCSDLQPSACALVPEEAEINTDDLIRHEGGNAIFVEADVTSSQQMQTLVTKAAEEYGRLDVMVNNAGIALETRTPGPIHTATDELWHKTMAVNTDSVFYGCKYATGQMLKQEPHPSGDRGWIINLSSILGVVAATTCPAYCASKGAVSNLTRSVALDYAKYRIHCNAICPGFTRTAIFAETTKNMFPREVLDAAHPLKGTGTPEDVAKAAVVLASEDASWITGIDFMIDGGYTAQ